MIEEAKRRGLGRGLSALLGEEADAEAARSVPIERLHPSRYQPRQHFDPATIEALARSIREKGVLQPLLVRRHPGESEAYEIIAGERRWRAAQLAQLHEVPVVLREIGDREALEMALVENLQREDLSVLEEADGYRRLIAEFQHTQEAIAESVGKSRSHITNLLRLLDLPDPVKRMLQENKLSAGHARALIGASDPTVLAEEVVRRGLNVRQTERLAQRAKGKAPVARLDSAHFRAATSKDADTRAFERDLSMALGLAVSIDPQPEGGGSVTVWYKTLDQLADVLRRLSQTPAGEA